MDIFVLGLINIIIGIGYSICLLYEKREKPEVEIWYGFKIVALFWFVFGISCILLGLF